jgi:hypothetical protein
LLKEFCEEITACLPLLAIISAASFQASSAPALRGGADQHAKLAFDMQ